jgi:probable rRNA maturation factor
MIKINVITNNKNWYRFLRRPDDYIDQKLKILNSKEKIFLKKNFFCTLLLSNDKEIKDLNNKFRKKNKTTDVLSFPFQTKQDLRRYFKEKKEIYLGDIIINLNKIKSKKNISEFKVEFDKLWVHGLIHLFGHDHKKKKDFLEMSLIEKKYMNLIND